MFRIHISRNRQPLGEFTPMEVAEGLKSGKFLPTDLAWREPMHEWKPLGEWDNLPAPESDDLPLAPETAEKAQVASEDGVEPAWERRGTLGVLPALVESVRQVYASPLGTFRKVPPTGGYKNPLTFYVILASISFWIAMAYQIAATLMNSEAVLGKMAKSIDMNYLVATQVFMIVVAPLFLALGAFISAGIAHFILQAFGGSHLKFEATLRAFCYAAGPAALLQAFPICGGLVSLVVSLVFFTLAMREVHGTDTFKAAVAVWLPAVVCCGLFFAMYAALVGAVIAQGAVK